MKTHFFLKGFTLVELAIVMTIIGLLIGGILKGQELIQMSRVTATIAQVRAIEVAITTFKDKYDAMPGDMSNASARIPGCNAMIACNPSLAAQAGNSIVGNSTWTTAGGNWATQSGPGPGAALVGGLAGAETVLFWVHLSGADLLSGVTTAALTGASAEWGVTHPVAKIGGGFVVGWGIGNRPPGAPAGVTGPSSLVLALATGPATALTFTADAQVVRPAHAAQIDRKIDDGASRTGHVLGYGLATSCFTGGAAANSYAETVIRNDCGLIFRIGG